MLVLITAQPAMGKTTALQLTADMLGRKRCRGIITKEIKVDGVRQGFMSTSIDGKHQAMLAHVDFPKDYAVEKFGVDIDSMNKLYDDVFGDFDDDANFYIVDEIGRMQMLSDTYEARIRKMIDTGKTIIATICYENDHPFFEELKERLDAVVLELTLVNRNLIPELIISMATQTDKLYQSKIMLARKYQKEIERYEEQGDSIVLHSTHGIRRISKDDDGYHCTCDYYRDNGTCSHILSLIMSMNPIVIRNAEKSNH